MNDDDRFDALLKQMAAEDYNRPPQIVPREAMWDAVRQELGPSARGVQAGGVAGLGAPLGAESRSPSGERRAAKSGLRFWRFAALAAAAVLLLAVGIGIGRRWEGNGARPPIAANPSLAPAPGGTTDPTAPAPNQPDDRRVVAASDNPARPAGPDRSSTDQPRPRPTGPDRAAPDGLADVASTSTYRVAAVHHLAEVEAMLTAFKADLGERRMDTQMSSWAKELLSSTRLLLDSPAGQDVARRKLLQDLELVLVQIVQLSPGTSASEREMIRGALTEDQVLTRLRTAIPAGQRGA